MFPFLFFLIAFSSEVVGTIAGFGSSVFFVPLAGLLLGFHEVLALTSILHVLVTQQNWFSLADMCGCAFCS
jgi:uncharacterized membrane protein YfcA